MARVAAKRSILQQMLADEESGPDGLALAGWGFAAVLAFLFASAAWQFTETPQETAQRLRLPANGPVEITGSTGQTQDVGIYGTPQALGKPSAMEKLLTEDLTALKRDLIAVRRSEATQRETNAALKERLAGLEQQLVAVNETLTSTRKELATIDKPPVPTAADLAEVQRSMPNVATRAVPLSPQDVAEARSPDMPSTVADAAVSELAADPIETGSISKTSRYGPATVRRVDGPVEGEAANASPPPPADAFKKTESRLLPIDAPLPPIDGPAPAPAGISHGPALPRSKPGSEKVVAAVPADTGDAAVSRSEFGIDLGGFATMAALKQHWKTFASEHPDLRSTLTPRAGISEKDGSLEVRLIAGPFVNAADAIVLCAKIGANGKPCQPALFSGQPVPIP